MHSFWKASINQDSVYLIKSPSGKSNRNPFKLTCIKGNLLQKTRKYALGPRQKSHQDWYQAPRHSQSICLSVLLPDYLLLLPLCSGPGCSLSVPVIWYAHVESSPYYSDNVDYNKFVFLWSSSIIRHWHVGPNPQFLEGPNWHSGNQVSIPCAFRYGQLCRII